MAEEKTGELAKRLSNVAWGFVDETIGEFVELPKVPLIQAGYTEPPFDVTLPNGFIRQIIQREREVVETKKVEAAPFTPIVKVSRKVKVYTASKLNHAPIIRDDISKWPEIEVTSRWPFAHVDGDSPLWPENCAAHGSIFWRHDEEDVKKADVVLLFGNEDDVLRGGLVEAGMAIGLGKHVIVVGVNPSYGTWQFHPLVYRVQDLATARSLLALIAADLGKQHG